MADTTNKRLFAMPYITCRDEEPKKQVYFRQGCDSTRFIPLFSVGVEPLASMWESSIQNIKLLCHRRFMGMICWISTWYLIHSLSSIIQVKLLKQKIILKFILSHKRPVNSKGEWKKLSLNIVYKKSKRSYHWHTAHFS